MTGRAVAVLLLAAMFTACRGGGTAPSVSTGSRGTPVELAIYAAASLKGALDKAKAAYETETPGIRLTISTDSSAALETKIEQGAPADLFLSADTSNPQKLMDGGYATGSIVAFAGTRLAVIVPKDNPAGIESAADLAEDGVDIIAAGDEVPITRYANQLVANLAREPGYPEGFAAAYAANIVSKEENVTAIVGKIELGQGDAGIVYATDAAASTQVATVDVPPDANVTATYGGVVVKASAHQAEAGAFLSWLAGPDGWAILAGLGFLPASS